jgi:hypothetical protein
LLARGLQNTWLAGFTRTLLVVATHLAAPRLTLAVLLGFVFDGSPRLTLAGMFVGVTLQVSVYDLAEGKGPQQYAEDLARSLESRPTVSSMPAGRPWVM